jgi:Tfp pilus assembly ATPase PilU
MIKNLGVTFLVATLLAPGAAWAEGGKTSSPNTNRTPLSQFNDVEIVLERHRAYCESDSEREREINQEIEKREAERRRINEEIKRNNPDVQVLIFEHLGYPICPDSGGIEREEGRLPGC